VPTTRQEKVSRLIQKELSDILQKESFQLCRGAMVTVTMVRISSDLSFAKTFVSIFCPGQKVEDIHELLKTNAKAIRTILGQRVRHQLRIVPEIAFNIDDSLDYIENIDKLLKNI
jgi:ribosome-binding factor A